MFRNEDIYRVSKLKKKIIFFKNNESRENQTWYGYHMFKGTKYMTFNCAENLIRIRSEKIIQINRSNLNYFFI